jgi:hypothetical protein
VVVGRELTPLALALQREQPTLVEVAAGTVAEAWRVRVVLVSVLLGIRHREAVSTVAGKQKNNQPVRLSYPSNYKEESFASWR